MTGMRRGHSIRMLGMQCQHMKALTSAHTDVRLKSESCLQVVNSLNGRYTDVFTFTKPVGWKANQTAQLDTISTFVANYTPGSLELVGLGSAADSLVADAAEKLLLSEPELLNQLRNQTYILVSGFLNMRCNPCQDADGHDLLQLIMLCNHS